MTRRTEELCIPVVGCCFCIWPKKFRAWSVTNNMGLEGVSYCVIFCIWQFMYLYLVFGSLCICILYVGMGETSSVSLVSTTVNDHCRLTLVWSASPQTIILVLQGIKYTFPILSGFYYCSVFLGKP